MTPPYTTTRWRDADFFNGLLARHHVRYERVTRLAYGVTKIKNNSVDLLGNPSEQQRSYSNGLRSRMVSLRPAPTETMIMGAPVTSSRRRM